MIELKINIRQFPNFVLTVVFFFFLTGTAPAQEPAKKKRNEKMWDGKANVSVETNTARGKLFRKSKNAMFHSKDNKFNIVDATPFKRDPMIELAQACKNAGLGFGFYCN